MIAKRLALMSLAGLLVLAGCTKLFPWTPVKDGADLEGDHVVHFEGVEIHVHQFGVYNEWGSPTAEVRTHNRSRKPVAFGIDGFQLDVGGTLVPANLNQEGEFPSIYLEPGEIYNTRLAFNTTLSLETGADGKQRVVPETLYLHLAPLVIDDVYHDLPVLAFRNPNP